MATPSRVACEDHFVQGGLALPPVQLQLAQLLPPNGHVGPGRLTQEVPSANTLSPGSCSPDLCGYDDPFEPPPQCVDIGGGEGPLAQVVSVAYGGTIPLLVASVSTPMCMHGGGWCHDKVNAEKMRNPQLLGCPTDSPDMGMANARREPSSADSSPHAAPPWLLADLPPDNLAMDMAALEDVCRQWCVLAE